MSVPDFTDRIRAVVQAVDRRIAVALVATALAAASCTTYEPLALAPETLLDELRSRSLVDVRPEAHDAGSGATVEIAFDPRDGVDEAELVAIALTLNPDLAAARRAIGESQALLITAGLLPNLTISAGWRSGIAGAPGYSADLDLLFELLRPGERELRRELAQARVDETRASVGAAEWRLVGEVRIARLEVWQRRRALEIADAESIVRRRLVESVRASAELGDASRLEVMVAELDGMEAEQAAHRAASELERARSTLNELVGLPASAELPLADLESPLVVRALAVEGAEDDLEARVVAGRPDLREIEATYRAAEAELELAVRRQYPSLAIGPSFGREPEHESYLGFALGLELPLFDRNQGEIAEKAARRESLRETYRSALHHAVGAARRALGFARATKREFDARSREAAPLADRLAELAANALRSRDIDAFDWIQAQRTLLDSRAAFLEAAVAYQRAVIEFEASIGSFASMEPAIRSRPAGADADDRR